MVEIQNLLMRTKFQPGCEVDRLVSQSLDQISATLRKCNRLMQECCPLYVIYNRCNMPTKIRSILSNKTIKHSIKAFTVNAQDSSASKGTV